MTDDFAEKLRAQQMTPAQWADRYGHDGHFSTTQNCNLAVRNSPRTPTERLRSHLGKAPYRIPASDLIVPQK